MSNIPIYYTEESVEKPWQLAFLFLGRLMIGGLQSPFDLFVQEIRDGRLGRYTLDKVADY